MDSIVLSANEQRLSNHSTIFSKILPNCTTVISLRFTVCTRTRCRTFRFNLTLHNVFTKYPHYIRKHLNRCWKRTRCWEVMGLGGVRKNFTITCWVGPEQTFRFPDVHKAHSPVLNRKRVPQLNTRVFRSLRRTPNARAH